MKIAVLGQGAVGGALIDALSAQGYEVSAFATESSDGGERGDVAIKDIKQFQPGDYIWVINCLPKGVQVEAPANGVLLDWSGTYGSAWWNDETPAPGEVVRPLPPAQQIGLRALRAVGLNHVLSADLNAISPVSRLGAKGITRLASETAKMLNGQGKDEGDIAFDLSIQDSDASGLVEVSELMPYQIGWRETVVPTFHGMALNISVLGNKNWADDLVEQIESVGFSKSDDINLQAIQEATDSLHLAKVTTAGPRLGFSIGFDPIAQLTQTTLELIDRPL